MGRQHRVAQVRFLTSDQIQGVGVEYDGLAGGQNTIQEPLRPRVLTQSRPDGYDRSPFQQSVESVVRIDGMHHELGPAHVHRCRMRRMGGDADQSRPAAKRGLARDANSAGHARSATRNQHVTEMSLVSVARAPWERSSKRMFRQTAEFGLDAFARRLGDCQIVEDNLTTVRRSIGKNEPGLEAGERYSGVRRYRDPHDPAGIAVQPRRYVEREDRCAMAICRLDGLSEVAANLSLETAAEHGVHDQLEIRVDIPFERQCRQAGFGEIVRRLLRIAREPVRPDQVAHCDLDSPVSCEARQHVAVTGVVAAAAQHKPFLRGSVAVERVAERRAGGPGHQRVAGDTDPVDCGAVDASDSVDGIIGCVRVRIGQIVHEGDYTVSAQGNRGMSNSREYRDKQSLPSGQELAEAIRQWGRELGFQQVGFSDLDLSAAEENLDAWLQRQYHGEMRYMEKHGTKRSRPAELIPGTLSVISVRMDYLPESRERMIDRLDHPSGAYVSRYALGRDYHKVLRSRLKALAARIEEATGSFGYRVFVDSAPVLEKPLAEKAGLGWIGKHTNLINRDDGSWFFLGELYTDLPLPSDAAATGHCGTCRACIDVCPTQAIVAPYELDARRCISYLTIELSGSIPEEFRKPIGNRVYGCDDCQIFCPWNKFARLTTESDFMPRHGLDDADMASLFHWSEPQWLAKTEGSAIRRLGYVRWLRNLAVGLGNARSSPHVIAALEARRDYPDDTVREHVEWALAQHAKNND